MAVSFERFIETSQGITDVAALNAHFHHAIAAEGYENFVFVEAGRRRPLNILCAELPSGYATLYQDKRWDLVDPVLQHSRVAKQPFSWSGIVHQSSHTSKEGRFFAACKDVGVHGGVTMPFHSPHGRTHVVSVSLRDGPTPDPRRIPYVYALAAQTWIRHSALVAGASDVAQIQLTRRERECLAWAKDGKTNWEISQILAVAERTVEFHVSNVMRKLNATNRVTAIVIAIQEGLIDI